MSCEHLLGSVLHWSLLFELALALIASVQCEPPS